MKVSLNWVKEYLDLSYSPEKIAEALTLAGLETEGLEERDGDCIFSISLTPNLGHCMSIVGIARELSAILQIPLKRKNIVFRESKEKIHTKVKIEDQKKCYKYACREVLDVSDHDSPQWLVQKLESAGLRSINILVDIGNLVMLECGQPLHLFDLDQVGETIFVRSSTKKGEKIKTLDGTQREIPEDVLLISDKKRPIAFAGVMGELSSSVTEKTKNILIEAAEFSPEAVRKTSKELNLRTESSLRFERGIDPLGLESALDMAAMLLQELAGGVVRKGISQEIVFPYTPHQLDLCPNRTNQILGIDLSVREMCMILSRLEIEILSDQPDFIRAAIPSYRNDLKSEIDLIEDIGRLYGFNHIPRKIPRHASSTLTHAPVFLLKKETQAKLIGQGLQEFLTCDLISPSLAKISLEKALNEKNLIHVLYPASIEQSVLRPSLLPGLLQAVKFNLDRQTETIAAFEVGHTHFKEGKTFFEEPTAGIILTGKQAPHYFQQKPFEFDFFDIKGQVENLLMSLGFFNLSFESSHLQNFHPGRQARVKINDIIIGALGEIHPQHLREMGIGQRVYYAEIHLHELKKEKFQLEELPLYPGSSRDWTITLQEKIPIGTILDAILDLSSPLLEKVFLFDLYKSDQIGKDRKNITFRFLYRDPKKTIAYEDVEKEHAKITEHIAKKFQVL